MHRRETDLFGLSDHAHRRQRGHDLRSSEGVLSDLAARLGSKSNVQQVTAFGKPGLKLNGKMFACMPDPDGIAFRLIGLPHERAMQLQGAHIWTPSSRDKPFKDWVYVPARHNAAWLELAQEAAATLESH